MISEAVRHFWKARSRQHKNQGAASGVKDSGNRSAVTGGKHLDGFINFFFHLIRESGIPDANIFTRATTLPGYFRPTKDWDLVVIVDERLLASIEFKAHVGPSFGNNFNNRVEEALGNSLDLLTAYREGKFKLSSKPWLGWLMLLEEDERSTSPVKVSEPHFEVFAEFKEKSYAQRYEIFCERLVRERLYDSACLILTNKKDGMKGKFVEPSAELSSTVFATSLCAHASAFAKLR
ncbi:MAG: PaeR7I family type II restriction endonuclease [Planctomycetes bacterium]|nr:PaeR7I family type II restriction endonuclease [Planctomycetota bacterium]